MPLTVFNEALMSLPWLVRVSIGCYLPLFIACGCLYQLRRQLRTEAAVQWLVVSAAAGWLFWITTREVQTNVPGGVMISVELTPAVAVLVTLVAGFVSTKKLDYKAVFAGAFFPLYLVDVLCSVRVFGSWKQGLAAVGGAGPLDGLLLIPLLAVFAAWAVGRDREALRRLVPTRG